MSSKQMSAFQKKKRQDNIAGYIFLIPAIITFLLFVGGPMIISFVMSFFDYNLIQPPKFIGLRNIRKFMMDPQVRISFANTFKFLLILVPVHCFWVCCWHLLFPAYIIKKCRPYTAVSFTFLQLSPLRLLQLYGVICLGQIQG